jgi:hypothetical protein
MTNPTHSPASQFVVPCADEPALFFSTRPAEIVAAQQICAKCPILADCADRTHALDLDTHGVFASVKLPPRRKSRKVAREQLAAVAATGKPAPLYAENLTAVA